MYGILSLDGGGVRGIIEAVAIQELEKTLGVSNLQQKFQIFAGSSTGALVACGLAAGWPGKKILDIYLKQSAQVFPTSHWSHLKTRISYFLSGAGISAPKYSGEDFNSLLIEHFGNTTFGELESKVLVTAYDIKLRTPVIFKSWKEEHKALKIADIARASASAPTFLPAHFMEFQGQQWYLVDGGIVANNPSICAVAEARRFGYTIDDLVLVSLGTGSSLQALNGDGTKTWGILQWLPHIVESLMDGASDVATYQAIQILGEQNVFRFQLAIPSEHSKLDDSRLKNLLFLETITYKYFRKPEIRLQLRALKEKLNVKRELRNEDLRP